MTSQERTFQSKPQMVAGAFGIVSFFFIGVSVVAFGSVPEKLGLGSLCLLVCVALYIYAQSNLRSGEEGISVSNPWSRYEVRWDQIDRFEVGRWRLNQAICLIRLRDGDVRPVIGIAESNFSTGSAQGIVDQLNDELGKRAPGQAQGAQEQLFGRPNQMPQRAPR
jgi:hypothetical protein